MLVYDVTNSSSFDILSEWLNVIRTINDENIAMPIIAMIGNKCDMEHQRSVKRDRSHRFAAENDFIYHDMSARTGEAVSINFFLIFFKIVIVKQILISFFFF